MNEKNLYIHTAVFHKSATKPDQYPKYPYPEFAFFGRSNVGKSSLLSMVISSKAEVKTSARPGHTQTINFFVINESLSFADLPGFGYAKAPGAIKDSFLPMIRGYIETRETLRVAFLLIDIRRTPGEEEQEILAALSKREIATAVVVTKADKLSNNQLKQRIREIAEELQINAADIFVSSSLKKSGRADLLKLIGQFSER